jgi:hypothetical protein
VQQLQKAAMAERGRPVTWAVENTALMDEQVRASDLAAVLS